jgi:ATP-dependent helicase/nuclease subunit B
MAGQAGAKERSTIVVRNALAARQWELHLCAQRIAGGVRAWETPPVVSYSAWLDELWLEHAAERGPALSPNQSSALWRRVIAESDESDELIGHAGAAEWAAGAWQLLHRWQIDAAEQRAAAAQVDYRAFLSWARRYRAWLDGHGCVDRAELEAALAAHATIHGRVVVADLAEQYPARATLLEQIAARGAAIEDDAVPDAAGTRFSARLADTADELRAAFAWARRRLEREPSTRVAIVIPTPARRQDEIERVAAAELGELASELVWTQGSSLAREPAIGAACEALTLGAAYAPYAAFGRWLRSPFFAAARVEPFARARLDAELRGGLMAQLPFQAAYRCGVKELLEQRAPESARSLAAALAALGTLRHATPSRWAHVASRFLVELGWQPPSTRAALLGWQSALDELARLTPIVGEVSLERALADLKRLLEGTAVPALPVRGIHVLARIEDVGPGYDAVWATGFTDAAWPEAPRGNPLLPLALQRAHRMPYSSPSDAQERSAGALERLVRRCPELVVSWPARVFDYETEPSPAIADWPMLSAAELDGPAAFRAVQRAARETLNDAAPPFAGSRVPGGTGALGRQARCPLRALCQDRLGARPLEALGLGVPARLRGIATHRAAEALLADAPAQASLGARLTEVPASVDRALARLFGRARSYLGAFYELEADLLRRVLTALLREELLRAPFRVRGVEQSVVAALGPLTFNVRIDRIDELADGTLAIIDYKTGDRATSADWFGERLRDAQVPLYATQSSSPVRAAVVARLSPEQTKYSGFWPDAAFPGRPSKGAHANAAAQLELWRTQLAQLAAELAAGDARIFIDDYDDAAGDYAPLTRVFEQLALARGAVARW